MSLKVDRLQLEIVINSDPARQKLRELNDESLKIQKGMKGMKEGSAEYLAESAKLKAVKTQMDGVYQSIGLTGLSLNELKKKQQEFNMAVRNLPANSPEYARYKKDLDDINGRITELTGKGKAAQGIMQTIFGVAGGVGLYEAAAAGIKKVASSVKDFFEEGIKAAIELRDAERVMLLELDGQRDVQKDLISLAKEKAKTTMFSRLELEVAEKFLINQERSPALIKKTIEAATNLATVTGVSLQNAVEDLDATMSGTMPKSLKRLEQGFRDLSKEQMYNGAAVDLINKKYSGEAQNEMDSYTGQLNIMEKAFRALRRTVGEWIIGSGGMFSAAIEGATALLNTFQKWFEIPISKKLEDEQSRVNFLAASLSDANISAENRNKLYRELETLAPGVVEGLDKENISYQKLTSNLAAYNDQMVNKIIIEKENEKVENVNEKLAKAKMETYNQEIYMREDILKTVTRLKKEAKGQDETNAAASIAHANKLTATLYDTQLTFSQKMKKLKEEHLVNIGAMNVYEINQEEQIKAQAAVNLQLQAKNTLIKELGINVQTVTAKNSETIKKEGTVISNYTKMTIDELNKLINAAAVMGATEKEKFESRQASAELKRREDSLKHQKSYTDDYAKIIQDAENIEKMNFAERLNRSQQDIKNVNEKYNNEIQKLREFKKAKEESGDLKPDQALGIDTEIYKLEITRKQQVNQVLLQAEKEFADEVKKVHENMRVARMAVTQRQLYEVKKKYSDMRKEIWDAIVYNYDQEVKAAEGNEDKIAAAKKKKGQEYAKIKHSMFLLKNAQQEEEDKITAQNEEKFVDELNNLKLKADKDLAVGTEKIHLEVNQKYKKLLEANVDDEYATIRIKDQMRQEEADRIVQLKKETDEKLIESSFKVADQAGQALSSVFNIANAQEDQLLKKSEDSNKKKKDDLKKRLDSGQISEKKYNTEILKIDQEADKQKKEIAHKQAVRQKELAIFNATISFLQAVIQAANIAPPADIILPIIVAAVQGLNLAAIIATPVPQAAAGRYNVIGQDDGQLYKDVPFIGTPTTGLYSTPYLGSEKGREIVIDNPTTENLLMNYPEVINAIKYAQTGKVPQHFSGKYSDMNEIGIARGKTVYLIDPEHTAALKENNELMKNGIVANVIFDDIRRAYQKIDTIESNASKKG